MQPLSPEFIDYISRQFPLLAPGLIEALENTPPAVAIRLNPRKGAPSHPPIATGATPVPWWRHGLYLPQRPDFTHDPALHQGRYYVQDASSMILATVVEHLSQLLLSDDATGNTPLRYLDACAAPGGKTTAAIDALPPGSLVVANEFDFRRAEILKENIMKWGYPSVAVSRGDTARFRKLPEWFHIVAADVPCSGEGMMRKDETARAQWSKRLVDECAARQRQILQNLWETLRPGGFLIYSTCTFNTDENDNNIDWLTQTFGAIPLPVPVPTQTGILTTPGGAMRFLPSLIRGEGLFMAVLQKPGTPAACNTTSSRKHRKALSPDKTAKHPQTADAATLARCMKWLNGDFIPQLSGETICAIPSDLSHCYRQLAQHLDLILQGVAIGSSKGRSITPHQGLALSSALNTDAFPTAPLNLSEALSFLRRESLRGFDLPKGPVLLTHQSMPLGFVNNLGNRSNNLYPAPWRILH